MSNTWGIVGISVVVFVAIGLISGIIAFTIIKATNKKPKLGGDDVNS